MVRQACSVSTTHRRFFFDTKVIDYNLNITKRKFKAVSKTYFQITSTSGRVARWAVNIDAVLNDILGRVAFSYFLKLEFSEENLQFWIDCENFRKAGENHARLIDDIIRKYVGQDAEMSVNLPSRLEESALANRELQNPR